MIHRNAVLSLRSDINRGCHVAIELSTGTVVEVTDVIGVVDESHVTVESDGTRLLLSLNNISAVSVSEPDADGLDVLGD